MRSILRREAAAAALGAILLAFAARSGRAEVIRIKMEKLVFTPKEATAHVGDTIEWTNADFVAHTATARNGAWDVMLAPHATRTLVLKAAGKVDYYCRFHPGMTGTITVAE